MITFKMFGSKINELNQSTFRDRPSLINSSGLKARVASVLLGSDGSQLGSGQIRQSLRDYMVNLPACPFHHQPIKYLCVSPTCSSSTFALCNHPSCRNLHTNPDTDVIDLDTFNDFIASNCTSLLLLSKKVSTYLSEIKQRLIMEMDKTIEKAKYIFQNIYMVEVPRLIRQKSYKDITSSKLFSFIKHDSFENNAQQRIQMEGLRNEVSARISELDRNFQRVIESKDFLGLNLLDVLKVTQASSPFSIMGNLDIHQFESSILDCKEDFQDVCKMLKENRAPAYNSIATIFRASEHAFSSEEFHRQVDGKAPILILVKTTLGKRFGAFVNCKIKQTEDWIPDATGLSFIFSLDRKEVYKLKTEAKCRLKAVFGGLQGPQIGSGCDLYLVDGCNGRKGSGANLGGSYRLPNYLEYNTPKSRSYLAGQQSFFVEQYQVFLLE